MGMHEITITTPAEWAEFISNNPDIVADWGCSETALHMASNGGLECGGGASPLTIVYFVDDAVKARIDAAWLEA